MGLNATQVLGVSKGDDRSIASGFKTAYPNADGSITVEFIDGTKVVTQPIKGDKGDKGDTGEQGIQGVKGDKGDQGIQGIKGDQGIQGIKGDTGEKGEKGEKGDKGDKGDQGADGTVSFDNLTPTQKAELKGDKGDKGDQGDKGDNGVSIANCEINADGKLVITLSDGTELTPIDLPTASVQVSKASGNIIEQKADGMYAPATDISGKVDKVDGKGLSTTDVTADMVSKWNSVDNKVAKEDGKSLVSNTDIAQISTNKSDIMTLNANDETNGSVRNLIKRAIEGTLHLTKEVVAQKPTVEDAKDEVLYLVPTDKEGVYKQYTKVGNAIVDLDNTEIDLSGYVQKEDGKSLVSNEDIAQIGTNKTDIGTIRTSLAYNAGDTVSNISGQFAGVVTNSSASIAFTVPLDKSINASVAELIAGNVTLRHTSGFAYIASGSDRVAVQNIPIADLLQSFTISIQIYNHILFIGIKVKSGKLSDADGKTLTNNWMATGSLNNATFGFS